ncbi:excalibur calcium-binding domain-containing protein [Nocardia vulneris]|uniref:excalibur calcium-binding domain-containing protein n=1 Tax=Nocardia vulneris TaxID=1141657 RepID=UPI0009E3140A|nr:excalibur calcium-binding domain-containing protein [Nocardia vulneris]
MTTTPRHCAAAVLLIAGISLGSTACGRTPAIAPTVHPTPSSTLSKPATATPTRTSYTTTSVTTPAIVPSLVTPPPTTVAIPQRFVPPAPAPEPPATPSAPPAPTTYYANCAAARAAGAAPLHRGEPGYRPGLDRPGDGVACE